MDRRRFLLVLAAGLAGASVVQGAGQLGEVEPAPAPRPAPDAAVAPVVAPVVAPAGGVLPPPTGVVDALPGPGASLALTIDDGTSSEVVGAFAALAAVTGIRLTFFPNGCYRSWEDNAAVLRPLVDSGQVALGNHTWSHPDLTGLGDREVAEEISRNRDFLRTTFGVRDSPFFRPPFGARDERTDRIAADVGHPTIAMWNGALGDSRVLGPDELLAVARQWFAAQAIIVGHANHPTVTTVYGQLLDLIAERGLRTVTLADVWATPTQRLRGATASGRVAR
jgi:peptidoglycan/xylan/chitin deacetylase (PgdA/CDA1 family)